MSPINANDNSRVRASCNGVPLLTDPERAKERGRIGVLVPWILDRRRKTLFIQPTHWTGTVTTEGGYFIRSRVTKTDPEGRLVGRGFSCSCILLTRRRSWRSRKYLVVVEIMKLLPRTGTQVANLRILNRAVVSEC